MRRSEWILGGLLGIIVVTILLALIFFWLNSQPEEEFDINNIENVTAVEAYNLAQPIAQNWSSDAALLSARASWQPEINFSDGRASWVIIFYSSTKSETAMISVADTKAQMVRTTPQSDQIQLGNVANWQLDSPAAIEQLLNLGADEFMTFHAKVNLILVLDAQETLTWRSTFLDTDTKESYILNITADTGEFTP